MKRLENKFLKVSVDDETGRITILNKITGVYWYPNPWGRAIAEIIVKANGKFSNSKRTVVKHKRNNSVIIKCGNFTDGSGRTAEIDITFEIVLSESEPCITFSVVSIENKSEFVIQEIIYPLRQFYLESGIDEGYIEIPIHEGGLIPSYNMDFRIPGYSKMRNWIDIYIKTNFNMSFFGARKGKDSFVCIIETPDDVQYEVYGNYNNSEKERRICAVSPVWQMCKGRLGYTRSAVYRFVEKGDYVRHAKHYREYVKRIGLFKSLKDKIKENPQLGKLRGAPFFKIWMLEHRINCPNLSTSYEAILDGKYEVYTNFRQLKLIIRELKNIGVKKALLILCGWMREGYDYSHPDVWPPDRRLGKIDELVSAVNLANKYGYLIGFHDDYHISSFNAPSFNKNIAMLDTHDNIIPCGTWDGGLAPLVCTKFLPDLLGKNLSKVLSRCRLNTYYLDVTSALPLQECYALKHPLTRSEDRKVREEMFKILNERNLVSGSEAGYDWAIPFISYLDGPKESLHAFSYGFPIPLYHLVYHDAVLLNWYQGTPVNDEFYNDKLLKNTLYGDPLGIWMITWRGKDSIYAFGKWQNELKKAYKLSKQFENRVAGKEMLSHSFITDDLKVERTLFEDNIEIVVNFGYGDIKYRGDTIPGRGYHIY